MNAVLTKFLITVGMIITIGTLALIVYKQHQILAQQTAIQTQIVAQQTLVDGIVRSQSQYATKDDIQQFAKSNDINIQAIQDNLNTLNAKLIAINVVHANSTAQTQTNVASTGTGGHNPTPATGATCVNGTCPSQDPFGYQATQQNLALNEDFGKLQVPFGTVGFSAWQQKPWSTNIVPRAYNIDTVIGADTNQRTYVYNKLNIVVDNKTYEIPVTGTTKQVYPIATFSWWNPRLIMGLDGVWNISHMNADISPSISVGIMSWGQYKTNPDFSILELGLGYEAINKTASVVITPFAYNIGKKILGNFAPNTYIGPSLQIGTNGSLGAAAGLRIGF
jgi:hypothetical protein